jgi:hypothetical protein
LFHTVYAVARTLATQYPTTTKERTMAPNTSDHPSKNITIDDILDQAHATFDLVHGDEDRDLNELSETDLHELWGFAFTTFCLAQEEGVRLTFTLADLEAAFNEPRGCPTNK